MEDLYKKILRNGIVYERKTYSTGWISVETLEVFWWYGLYTKRQNGNHVEYVDLDDTEFGKTLFATIEEAMGY